MTLAVRRLDAEELGLNWLVAFTEATPYVWNALSADVRLCETVVSFKKHLKMIFQQTMTPVPMLLGPRTT